MPNPISASSFVEFPDRQGILEGLRSIEVYDSTMEPMFRSLAERLDSRAYDRSAFVFILLELIYELEDDTITFSDLLGRIVFALTADLDLVGEALEAFEEVRVTLAPGYDPLEEAPSAAGGPSSGVAWASNASGNGDGPPSAAQVGGPESTAEKADTTSHLWAHEADQEHLMLELQGTQKRVLDFGLATRVSIEMALARPSRENVKQTLRDMSELRRSLLRFEELLRESEERILAAIGVLD